MGELVSNHSPNSMSRFNNNNNNNNRTFGSISILIS